MVAMVIMAMLCGKTIPVECYNAIPVLVLCLSTKLVLVLFADTIANHTPLPSLNPTGSKLYS